MRRDISFQSDGIDLSGWLYVPDVSLGNGPWPAVIMANAFTAVKETHLSNYAKRFAAADIGVLVFDYRNSGGSGGEPRSQVFPHERLDDLRNAISRLRRQPEIDAKRIVACDVPRRVRQAHQSGRRDDSGGTLAQDREARYASGVVNYLPLVAPPAAGRAAAGRRSASIITMVQFKKRKRPSSSAANSRSPGRSHIAERRTPCDSA